MALHVEDGAEACSYYREVEAEAIAAITSAGFASREELAATLAGVEVWVHGRDGAVECPGIGDTWGCYVHTDSRVELNRSAISFAHEILHRMSASLLSLQCTHQDWGLRGADKDAECETEAVCGVLVLKGSWWAVSDAFRKRWTTLYRLRTGRTADGKSP